MSGDAADDDGAVAERRWNAATLAQPVTAPVWRLWAYERPAVVLGRAQQALQAAAAAATRLPVLVRDAGGGAVLTGPWMIGLSAALPVAHALAGGGVVAGYRWLGEGMAQVLREHGVAGAEALSPMALRELGASAAPDWACFGSLSPWEVVVGRRKIVGLAQVRRRTGVLLVGGVLLDETPWALLCEALGRPAAEAMRLQQATTSCAQQSAPAAAAPLRAALQRMLDDRLSLPAAPAG